jgi:GntR family negative regulator for fad regulon and positive regulator of fabA
MTLKRSRPALDAEQSVLRAILGGSHPPGSTLPAERALAAKLGVTRPTLREALQRLERDGWLVIRQGKGTRVNDFWQHGGLNVLSALARSGEGLPPGFVARLLEVRCVLAPAYTRAAVARAPRAVAEMLARAQDLEDTPRAFASFDWLLHHGLAVRSGNPIYALILNGFATLYETMALRYFGKPESRQASRAFYLELHAAARRRHATRAERITRSAMARSLALWNRIEGGPEFSEAEADFSLRGRIHSGRGA